MTLVSRLLHWLAPRLFGNARVIFDRAGGSPYLSRWYVFGVPKASDGLPVFDAMGNPRAGITWNERTGPIGVYLHKFHRGDDDPECHNHPWRWSIAIILSGGYVEERIDTVTGQVRTRRVRPGMVNFIRANDFHRVELLGKDSWSLFIAGPRMQSWGFFNSREWRVIPWREFIARKRGQVVEEVRVS